MKETEKAYIAAFFDGEGTIYSYKYKGTKNQRTYARIVVRFYNTDKEVLEWIKSLIGGSIYLKEGGKIFKKTKQCYALQLTEGPIKKVFVELLPYLRVKRKKVIEILNYEAVA